MPTVVGPTLMGWSKSKELNRERPSVRQLPAISWGATKTTAAPEC